MKIFVIMPFSETTEKHNKKYWNDFYKKISNICSENKTTIEKMFNVSTFKIHRASAPQGNVVKSILRDLKECDIVIAVLTDHNSNVFYELGIRHTQSKPTIMLCEESQNIPFDLKNYGVGLYKDNKLRYKQIEKELIERFEQIASNLKMPDNPFSDFFGSQQDSVKSRKPEVKIGVVNQIEGESYSHPPKFYREALRKGGEVDYKNRTFFAFIIELMNNGTEPIAIFDTELEGSISSQLFSTKKLYHGNYVETARDSVVIRPEYKNKFTLKTGFLQQLSVFILDQSVPKDIPEILGRVHVTDMSGNKYSSSEIKFISYSGN